MTGPQVAAGLIVVAVFAAAVVATAAKGLFGKARRVIAGQQRLSKSSIPLTQARAEVEGKHNFHDVQVDQLKAMAAYPGEDWVTKEECRKRFTEEQFDGGWWYKNHYSACQVAEAIGTAYTGDFLVVDHATDTSGMVFEVLEGDGARRDKSWPNLATLLAEMAHAVESGQPLGYWDPHVSNGVLNWQE